MKKFVISLAMATVVLLIGCTQEPTELEQVRLNKEKVEAKAKELKYPYKEIKTYFESEQADSDVLKRIQEIAGYPLMDVVQGGAGPDVAKAGINYMKRVKEVNEFEPLEEWLTGTESLFNEALVSGDEEVEYDKLGEAQEEIEKIKELMPEESGH